MKSKPLRVENKSTFYKLDRTHFELSDIQDIRLAAPQASTFWKEWEQFRKSGSALGFGHYPFYFGLRVVSTSKPGIFAQIPNADKSGIVVTQTTLFSKYANTPPHEPSGGLTAARFHPMVKTKFTDNVASDPQGTVRSEIVSIRYDYFLHLNLDRHHDNQVNSTLEQLGNQAGVFKDEESLDIGGAIDEGVRNLHSYEGYGQAQGAVFKAVEKPLLLEISALGLNMGASNIFGENGWIDTWDNIHWWGAHRFGFPSTPGAYHACHLHWRWGSVIAKSPFGSEPQFVRVG